MKKSELEGIIREAVKKRMSEAQPQIAPSKPGTEPITKPGTNPGKPKPRRGFEPRPGVQPAPKAMSEGEKEIVAKMVQRMKSAKKINEGSSIDSQQVHQVMSKFGDLIKAKKWDELKSSIKQEFPLFSSDHMVDYFKKNWG